MIIFVWMWVLSIIPVLSSRLPPIIVSSSDLESENTIFGDWQKFHEWEQKEENLHRSEGGFPTYHPYLDQTS